MRRTMRKGTGDSHRVDAGPGPAATDGAKPVGPASGFWKVVAVGFALAGAPAAVAEVPEDVESLREEALDLVNRARREEGLPPLELGEDLVEAAQAHAGDMLERDYYAHESPEGDTVRDRYQDAGGSGWELVAENIARCQGCQPPVTEQRVESLHEDWMESPPHRKNILGEGLATFGFGLAVGGDDALYAVQTFAGPGVPRDLQPGEEPVPLTSEEQGALAVRGLNRARERAGLSPVEPSAALDEAARALLPAEGEEEFALGATDDLFSLLPEGQREGWRALSVVAGACGGCGIEPLAADIRQFRNQWLDDPRYRDSLLDPEATHAGFALDAGGGGRKVAVLVIGQRR